jgi:hypothetical protein
LDSEIKRATFEWKTREQNLIKQFEMRAVWGEDFLGHILQRHLLCRDYALYAEVHPRFLLYTFFNALLYFCDARVVGSWKLCFVWPT